MLAHLALERNGDNDRRARARGQGTHGRRARRRRGPVRRIRGAPERGLVGGRPEEDGERRATEGLAVAERIERRDLEISEGAVASAERPLQPAAQGGASPAAARACDRAGRRGCGLRRPAAGSCRASGRQAARRTATRRRRPRSSRLRELFVESGAALTLGTALRTASRSWSWQRGDLARQRKDPAARRSASSSRSVTANALGETPSASSPRCCSGQSRVDEAKRVALEARETVGCDGRLVDLDEAGSRSGSSSSRRVVGYAEAERLLRRPDEILQPTGYRRHASPRSKSWRCSSGAAAAWPRRSRWRRRCASSSPSLPLRSRGRPQAGSKEWL